MVNQAPAAQSKWPEGTELISLEDELDDDDDKERITPAGSTWEVISVDEKIGIWYLGCPETGASICADENAMLTAFKPV